MVRPRASLSKSLGEQFKKIHEHNGDPLKYNIQWGIPHLHPGAREVLPDYCIGLILYPYHSSWPGYILINNIVKDALGRTISP